MHRQCDSQVWSRDALRSHDLEVDLEPLLLVITPLWTRCLDAVGIFDFHEDAHEPFGGGGGGQRHTLVSMVTQHQTKLLLQVPLIELNWAGAIFIIINLNSTV